MPNPPGSQRFITQPGVPMWDSSDPKRNPAPLPPNPRDPTSPKGPHHHHHNNNNSSAPSLAPPVYDDDPQRREPSPRRGRENSFEGGPLHRGPLPVSPGRAPPAAPTHKRASSSVTSPGVRDVQNMLLHHGKEPAASGSGNRHSTPTPRDLFGSNTSFPLPKPQPVDAFTREYSSESFRKSLGFDGGVNGPGLPPPPPPPRHAASEMAGPSSAASALTHAKSFSNLNDHASNNLTIHDYHSLSAQLSGLTAIATNLQREMANLSRRSKDNATDLMSLKEATKSRDEDIRRSLRDLQNGLTSFEATDRLLEHGGPRLSIMAPSNSSGSDSGRDSVYGDEAALVAKVAHASTQALERMLRDMPSKEDQDRALEILREIQQHIKQPGQSLKGVAEEKILSVLQEIKEREESGAKALALPGAPMGADESTQVLSMLATLRNELNAGREGEKKILETLEEIKGKEAAQRTDEEILDAIEELKTTDGVSKLDKAVSLLEELRDREFDVRAVALLEEVLQKMEDLSGDAGREIGGAVTLRNRPSSTPPDPSAHASSRAAGSGIPSAQWDELVDMIKDVKNSVSAGGSLDPGSLRALIEDSRQQWSKLDKNVLNALEGLQRNMETLAAEQQASIARVSHGPFSGLTSQALTKPDNLPPDLDNEAAITALANIASTTTRTDITLSAINALIKVFQKETHSSSTNTTEALNTMTRFLDEIGDGLKTTTVHTSEARKILEVVRTGICSGNDRLAEFEGIAVKHFEEITFLQKELQRQIGGEKDQEGFEKVLGAIAESNPAQLIVELQAALGAMAQRSLEAFKRSEDAINKLVENSAPDSRVSDKIDETKTELKELAQKSIALCEEIAAKSGSTAVVSTTAQMTGEVSELLETITASLNAQAAEAKASLKTFLDGMDGKIEDAVATAAAAASSDERTAQALEELKAEVSEKLSRASAIGGGVGDSAGLAGPIEELRKEVSELMAKSGSALAAPSSFPQAEEIKANIEMLAVELKEAMMRTVAVASGSSNAGQQVTEAVEALRRDIGDMESSIAKAVTNNSASAIEEGMKGAFEDMKDTVLVKVEAGLQSTDKAISDIANLSQETKDAIEGLKKEVTEMMEKSISMAVATVNPGSSQQGVDNMFEKLKTDLEDVIISSVAAGTGSDELKEVIQELKSDIDNMGKQIVPASETEKLHPALEEIKQQLSELAAKVSASPAAPAADSTTAIDKLRTEVREMIEKTSTMLAPIPSPALAGPVGTIEEIEKVLASLKADVNDMVESSLAAAIANSTFDSEENVKNAIEELKHDVRDTLQKSMVPASHANNASGETLRVALTSLRQEISAMFEKKTRADAEDKEEVVKKLDSIKGQFGEFLQTSASVEIKDAVDSLKQQVAGLAGEEKVVGMLGEIKEKLAEAAPAADNTELVKAIKDAVDESTSNLSKIDDVIEVKVLVEEFRKDLADVAKQQLSAMKGLHAGMPMDKIRSELKDIIRSVLPNGIPQMDKLAPGTPSEDPKIAEVKRLLEQVRSEVNELAEKSPLDDPSLQITPLIIKTAVDDVHERVRDARVDIEVLKTLVNEKSDDMVTEFREVKMEQNATQLSVKAVRDDISNYAAKSAEGIAGVESRILDLQSETKGSFAAWTSASAELQAGTQGSFDELKVKVDAITEQNKNGYEELNQTVEGARAEITLGLTDLSLKVDTAAGEVKDLATAVKSDIEEARAETGENFVKVHSAVDAAKDETKQEIAAVKEVVDETRAVSVEQHSRTQEQVQGVLSLVEGLQAEWKDQQPVLSTAFDEIKTLLLAAQTAIENQPVYEPPPAYDDSNTQSKLDQLLSDSKIAAKQLPRLDLLDNINKTVATTSTELADFIAYQKAVTHEDVVTKINQARQAERDLEKALAEKYALEAALDKLHRDHDKLIDTVDRLREETEDLRGRKLRLTGEVASLEMALTLRREELLLLEARGEALERRMLEGVIEQSRQLLEQTSSKKKKPRRPKQNPALDRRHLSLSQLNPEITSPSSQKMGRGVSSGGTSLGLGQTDYAASLGLLGRSQSVKQTSYSAGRRKGSIGTYGVSATDMGTGDIREEEGEGEYGVASEDEGSVIRVEAGGKAFEGYGGALDDDGGLGLEYVDIDVGKEDKYPALGLDFGEPVGRRNSEESVE